MSFAYNEEQRSLKDTARDFANDNTPVEALRKLRDSKDPVGYSRENWGQMIELGFGGIIFPEAYGGFEFGVKGLAGCFEEFGRTLTASPLLSSVALSGSLILEAGSEEQKQELLPAIAMGEKQVAVALEESSRHNPAGVALSGDVLGNGFKLNGKKTLVVDGHVADLLIVAARTSGQSGEEQGISLFLVDPKAEGVEIQKNGLTDSRNYARISFTDVELDSTALLGEEGNGFAALDKALDVARICLSAEVFGSTQEVFERTVQYFKERKQFGVLIGTFQALQHRAAFMFTEIQVCKTLLMNALNALESGADNAPAMISAARAKICEIAELVTNEAVQLHGGIGVTDELEIGLFLKRARTSQILFGDERFHYDRYATLSGF
ncbi:acyl-CoA dehydrogenase [Endozoicomonas sp. OPT23]|uniref:acyl-CoA dehydrogenase family protein n=1 Tax=Endozoicomonas sp. OPT23 TaxID=2072845 RepID=UPI00129BA9A3|nr:acyl-CoA dehydrogenase family protein [Endozoicomonas sp. OPT23]MRI33842.1 acyl-CoA dehydrogenase [Endozoicomonas sp. OPT23]